MRALVAGGAGFVGSHLCDLLLDNGFEVLCLDSLLTGSKRNIRHLLSRPDFRFQRVDVTKRLRLPGRVDVVFNLASPASPKDYMALPLATLAVGSSGTRNLLEVALGKKAVFVQASTSEIYGDPLLHPQPESYWGNVNSIGPRSAYDEAKRFGEALVMAYHRRYGLATRIARIFNTYGPRMKLDDGRIVPTLVHQALTGRPLTVFGTGRQTRSFCYVSDMVEGLYRLASCSDPMPVNLGNPHEFTILRFAQVVKKLTGSVSPLKFEPLPEDDPKRRRPNISRAQRLLRWQPKVQLEPGLKLTIDSFRKKT
ncbi:SDR family oxidoreductase [candidate division WOR-3 bacterium]|uniref:SDR family oxidoreductase n=1 Tax=candidate division WOR-3 bacterium TaxID=2052148 RepID=A0A938BU34_UNCW3|nr:SDR family oxidoreductase [candidate division WOR-3 bacterium]